MKKYIGLLLLVSTVTACQISKPSLHKGSKSPKFLASNFMEECDVNGDGKVPMQEFDGSPRIFFALDQDNDGVITPEEVAKFSASEKEK